MRTACLLVVLVALCGCRVAPERVDLPVDLALDDQRPNDVIEAAYHGYNSLAMNLIPLLPWFLTNEMEYIERSHQPELRRALAARFGRVSAPGDPGAERVRTAQLRVTLERTYTVTRGINYGLGPFAFALHWLLPSNNSSTTVKLRLTLRRPGQPDLVGSGHVTLRDWSWWFYEDIAKGEEAEAAVAAAVDEAADELLLQLVDESEP